MLVLLDTETKEVIAKFANEELARLAGRAISEETHRPITIAVSEAAVTRKPVARFVDGEEILQTASIHYL